MHTKEEINRTDKQIMRALAIAFVLFIMASLVVGGLMNLFL